MKWIADKIEHWPTDKLIPYARNARTHSDAQVAQIAASIAEFGFTNPILVGSDGVIIAGHGRLAAAQKLGLEVVPVVVLDHLTPTQRRALIIADNRLAENAGWDDAMLLVELEDLKLEGFDLNLTGFDSDALAELMAGFEPDNEGQTDEDAVPEVGETPISRLGDVWVMGQHRLLCGDSTVAESYDRLMRGEMADMVFTDPPYNVGSESKGIARDVSKAHRDLMLAWWDKDFDIEKSLKIVNSVMSKNCVVYICSSHYLICKVWAWMKEWSDFYSFCVWSKPDPMPSLTKRHWTFDTELIAYATRGKHVFNAQDGKHSPSTWIISKNQGSEKTGHPTQKPVAVPQHAIEKSSLENNIVLDLFGGSGSTLIACEKTRRKCRMIEINPKYCDVIVRRWQDFTGKQATRESDGKTFNEAATVMVENEN